MVRVDSLGELVLTRQYNDDNGWGNGWGDGRGGHCQDSPPGGGYYRQVSHSASYLFYSDVGRTCFERESRV